MRQITFAPTFAGWQREARRALRADWLPEEILWQELGSDEPLLDLAEDLEATGVADESARAIRVPREFMELATRVACHRAEARWPLLYRTLWRITHGEHHLMQVIVDPDVNELAKMDKAIRHDVHKMRAFVRFRQVQHEGVDWYVAWFEPAHYIVEMNAPFFVDRFSGMRWSILTPDRCVHWDGARLSFTGGAPRSAAPTEDATEALWLRYYSHIFNPARVKINAMEAEMPRRYWKNLPETAVIPALLREAPARVETMMKKSRARTADDDDDDFHPIIIPDGTSLTDVRKMAKGCTACPLYRNATQTVFGEGAAKPRLVFVGEQPGDKEDQEGHPFIGPAGQLFDRALADAGIDRAETYVTNAVKHFKWEPSGKRRLHKTASPREVAACRAWLEAELSRLEPSVVVCLGATAARSVLGPAVRVTRDREEWFESEFCPKTAVTVHPSSLLRAPDEASREENYQLFVRDLRRAGRAAGK